MKFKLILLVIFLPLLWLIPAKGQEIEVNSSASPSKITIGDLVKVNITIKANKDFVFDFTGKNTPVGEFILRDFSLNSTPKDNYIIYNLTYILTIYKTGEFLIPAIKIKYRRGKEEGTVTSTPMLIKVISILPPNAKDIKDIKPIAMLPWWITYSREIITVIIVLTGIMLVILLLLKWSQHSYKIKEVSPPVPALSPEEEAFKALRLLEEDDLLRKKDYKNFYFKLSEILRRYLERVFQIPAMENTTEELKLNLKSIELPSEWEENITKFLIQSDLVKFARFLPKEEEALEHFQLVKNLIRKIKLKQDVISQT